MRMYVPPIIATPSTIANAVSARGACARQALSARRGSRTAELVIARGSRPASARQLPHDEPVREEEHPIGHRRGLGVVRHHHVVWPYRRRLRAGARGSRRWSRVEVAGRLVGEDDGRPRDERAGDRDPLLLAAGELRRAVRAPVVRPTRRSAPRTRPRRACAGDGGAGAGCSPRGQHRQQVEELEDEADVLAAKLGQLPSPSVVISVPPIPPRRSSAGRAPPGCASASTCRSPTGP